ncbi:hypothetical protein [Pseudomonas putida]|uniref:hypothetical protein n=1 Tax=Pseudomonas putida TaxID=303 RepID=UPI0038078B61
MSNENVMCPDGRAFALTFIKGIPPCNEVLLFLLDDGSIHQGVVIYKPDETYLEKRVVSTTNPIGGFHTKLEISLRRVAGYAYCQPLFDTSERSMWFDAGFVADSYRLLDLDTSV